MYELLPNLMAPIRLSEDTLRNFNCPKLRTAHALLTMLVTREEWWGVPEVTGVRLSPHEE